MTPFPNDEYLRDVSVKTNLVGITKLFYEKLFQGGILFGGKAGWVVIKILNVFAHKAIFFNPKLDGDFSKAVNISPVDVK